MDFASAYAQGFARVAACTVPVRVADPDANAREVVAQARRMAADHVAVAVFPELCLTGYAVDDLFLQDALLDAAARAVDHVRAASAELGTVLVVGAPLGVGNRLFNCAVVIHRGRVLGVAPKSYVPTYREFYEKRQIAAGDQAGATDTEAGRCQRLGLASWLDGVTQRGQCPGGRRQCLVQCPVSGHVRLWPRLRSGGYHRVHSLPA